MQVRCLFERDLKRDVERKIHTSSYLLHTIKQILQHKFYTMPLILAEAQMTDLFQENAAAFSHPFWLSLILGCSSYQQRITL
jgi:hypothetical protein